MADIYANHGLLIFLALVAGAGVVSSLLLWYKMRNVRIKLNDISNTLDDIALGNSNLKILAKPTDMASSICYKINEIVHDFQHQVTDLKKAEETHKQLMTSLSHDVRTPLTTLIGYLDAVQKGIVSGAEREEYIETARRRAHDMKDYVDMLFEWFKLHSHEETFLIGKIEFTELNRSLLKDWVPIFESHSIQFDIDIPDKRIEVNLDRSAYSRILNNLIQNVVSHSRAKHIQITISMLDRYAEVIVGDDGEGINKQDLLRVFDRLYKCDKARSQKGSGLGLSIVQHLVIEMGGIVTVNSDPGKRTEFTIRFPLAAESPC